ncbi:MAG: hypothetical protein J1F17_03050 [Oscillospiraceae bacterium]|nr:hypothetical protein [Oscillospiraceae bacterium]
MNKKIEDKLTKQQCIDLLKNKFNEENRLPKKSDFSEYEVMMIKSHLGPWPRALEASGVKPERSDEYLARKKEKRERAKKRKSEYIANKKQEDKE